jgi:CBS domain containing-hemolysin-like protein
MDANFIFGAVFAVCTLLAIGLQRTYYHYPVKELKRRARKGDQLAQMLYRPVSYGLSLQVLLWGLIIASAAVSFVLLARAFAPWFGVVLVALILWLGFLWIPSSRLTAFSIASARLLTPGIAWLVNLLHPVLQFVGETVRRFRHMSFKTGLYEKEDLIELLESQRGIPENRIPLEEIDLVQHALTFGDMLVRDTFVPRRSVLMIKESEPIGPKLMDELYQSGHSRFPVYKDDETNIVGTLYMRDMVKKQTGGHVKDVMREDVFYVHEDFTLYQVLQAFLKTKHHMFIVVNSFEEFVGIITIEDVVEQIIGKPIVDEFDKYDDMRAVASAAAKTEHEERVENNEEPTHEITDGETDTKVVK